MEHQSIKQVLADPLTKGLPPKSTWVLRKAYDFWITKGPKERLRSCFNTERCIVAVNLTVTDNCHDEARAYVLICNETRTKSKTSKKKVKRVTSRYKVFKV